jgi:hypothetical protein
MRAFIVNFPVIDPSYGNSQEIVGVYRSLRAARRAVPALHREWLADLDEADRAHQELVVWEMRGDELLNRWVYHPASGDWAWSRVATPF